jgi:ankyrin repeat protein
VARALVNRGAELRRWCLRGYTALHAAAEEGHLHLCSYLVDELGADCNQTN